MAPNPPSFGSQDYWNQRFTSNTNPFEWLEAPNALDPFLVAALDDSKDPSPEILHIGCGTSLLSFHLRAHVEKAAQVHNVDYSEVAIDLGRKREPELLRKEDYFEKDKPDGESSSGGMRWSATNLLDHASLLGACEPLTYSLIVDKSTSDSIACMDDVFVSLPYHLATTPALKTTRITTSSEPIHPLHILAVHLAIITKPRGKWIALSYSMDRFPFLPVSDLDPHGAADQSPLSGPALNPEDQPKGVVENDDESLDETELDDLDGIPSSIIDSGFPDPSTLWRLSGKYEIEPPSPERPDGLPSNGAVHRPKVFHYVYVLERTDVPLYIRTKQ